MATAINTMIMMFSRVAARRSLLTLLKQLAPDYSVFCIARPGTHLPIAPANKTYDLRRTGCDFVLCDATFTPVMALGLDHRRRWSDQTYGDNYASSALKEGAFPVLRLPVRRSYSLEYVRRLIFPHLHGFGPAC